MVDVRLLTFLTLYKEGSYTKASEKLYISQPSVTNHIKSLQKELDCQLFTLEHKKLKLTKAGQLLLEYANKEIHSYNRFSKQISEVYKVSNDISLATKATISENYLGEIFTTWIKKFPKSQIELNIKKEKNMFEALDSGEVSFVITDQMIDKRISRYVYKPIKTQNIVLVVGKEHHLSKTKEVSLKDLENERWFLTGSTNTKYRSLKHKFMLHNLNLKSIENFTKIENDNTIIELVKNNLGITFVTKDFIKKELDNNELVEVSVKDFNIMKELLLVYVQDISEEKTILEFYDVLLEYFNDRD